MRYSKKNGVRFVLLVVVCVSVLLVGFSLPSVAGDAIAGDGHLDLLYPTHTDRYHGPFSDAQKATSMVVHDGGRDLYVRFGGIGRDFELSRTAEWDGEKWLSMDLGIEPHG